jgi:hypothetical protein
MVEVDDQRVFLDRCARLLPTSEMDALPALRVKSVIPSAVLVADVPKE